MNGDGAAQNLKQASMSTPLAVRDTVIERANVTVRGASLGGTLL